MSKFDEITYENHYDFPTPDEIREGFATLVERIPEHIIFGSVGRRLVVPNWPLRPNEFGSLDIDFAFDYDQYDWPEVCALCRDLFIRTEGRLCLDPHCYSVSDQGEKDPILHSYGEPTIIPKRFFHIQQTDYNGIPTRPLDPQGQLVMMVWPLNPGAKHIPEMVHLLLHIEHTNKLDPELRDLLVAHVKSNYLSKPGRAGRNILRVMYHLLLNRQARESLSVGRKLGLHEGLRIGFQSVDPMYI